MSFWYSWLTGISGTFTKHSPSTRPAALWSWGRHSGSSVPPGEVALGKEPTSGAVGPSPASVTLGTSVLPCHSQEGRHTSLLPCPRVSSLPPSIPPPASHIRSVTLSYTGMQTCREPQDVQQPLSSTRDPPHHFQQSCPHLPLPLHVPLNPCVFPLAAAPLPETALVQVPRDLPASSPAQPPPGTTHYYALR